MSKFNYSIHVQELDRPIGGVFKYVAKLAYFYEASEAGGEQPVSHGLGETWGATKEEAYNKMDKQVKEWINLHKQVP